MRLQVKYYCQASKFLHIVSMVAYQINVAHQCLLPLRRCLFSSLAAPPNSHIQNKVIPGSIGTEMRFSLQMFSSFRCLFVVRFERDIVLSSLYDIAKARIHHVMPLWRYFYSPKLRSILSKVDENSGDLLWVSSFKSWSCMKLNLQQNLSATLTNGFVKRNVNFLSAHKCIT